MSRCRNVGKPLELQLLQNLNIFFSFFFKTQNEHKDYNEHKTFNINRVCTRTRSSGRGHPTPDLSFRSRDKCLPLSQLRVLSLRQLQLVFADEQRAFQS